MTRLLVSLAFAVSVRVNVSSKHKHQLPVEFDCNYQHLRGFTGRSEPCKRDDGHPLKDLVRVAVKINLRKPKPRRLGWITATSIRFSPGVRGHKSPAHVRTSAEMVLVRPRSSSTTDNRCAQPAVILADTLLRTPDPTLSVSCRSVHGVHVLFMLIWEWYTVSFAALSPVSGF